MTKGRIGWRAEANVPADLLGTEVPSPRIPPGTEVPSPRIPPGTEVPSPLPLSFAPALPVSPSSLGGQTVWVIDSHSLIHQVFHALPEMTSPKGEPVGAVFGFTRDLLFLLEEKKPDYLFCAFDLPGKTFRHAMYDQYKIQRAEMHEDLAPQIPAILRVIAALGIPALGCESFEADDVLATVARHDRRARRPVLPGDRRQGLPATDHRSRQRLQHPQERGVRAARCCGPNGESRRSKWSTSRRWSAIRSITCRACR